MFQKPVKQSPFQGPIACTRIKKGKGVCCTSWADQKTLIVPSLCHKLLYPFLFLCMQWAPEKVIVLQVSETLK
ncbi:hypothetical protein AH06_00790 [candidate division TM6 bacterium Zodletone_IIa]|nr:hypothetical protein AH06_00790 [candidate division TM6 bacterium Zodletone_IIa]